MSFTITPGGRLIYTFEIEINLLHNHRTTVEPQTCYVAF